MKIYIGYGLETLQNDDLIQAVEYYFVGLTKRSHETVKVTKLNVEMLVSIYFSTHPKYCDEVCQAS